ncbi:hypothetical protein RBE51_18525 [Pseudomonas taiwanensis]|uniref:hypothetical protein n=1 Tax=Pseudomonas taiwanensis TaxID=470150 RepID=UPI0028E088AB|nr:hypothetical protein [Pseudomonas taiwanensis]MDT8924789.1 hypothetical protein [Pseudomonas taiwanensis]
MSNYPPNFPQRLALRAALSKRQSESRAPEEMKVVWALEAESLEETNAQIWFLAARSGRLFKMALDEQLMGRLINYIHPNKVPILLEGLVTTIEEGQASDINRDTLGYLLPALKGIGVDYSDNMRALLKGRLYHALCQVVPTEGAAELYEALALKHEPDKHCVVFNSFYEHTLETLAQQPAISAEGNQHLGNLAKSAHWQFYDDVREVDRWVKQFEYLGKLRATAAPENVAVLDELIGRRASHLGQWLASYSPAVALAPFSGVKTITKNEHAHRVLDTFIKIATCINHLPPDSAEARACANVMIAKVIQGLGRYSDSLGTQKWASFERQTADRVDWKAVMGKIPTRHRKVIAEHFSRVDLFGDFLNEREAEEALGRELGL